MRVLANFKVERVSGPVLFELSLEKRVNVSSILLLQIASILKVLLDNESSLPTFPLLGLRYMQISARAVRSFHQAEVLSRPTGRPTRHATKFLVQ